MAITSPHTAEPVAPPPSFDETRRALEALRGALDAEIRGYPTPVAGCDAQYNHLLAQRRRVRAALAALDAPVHIPTPRAP